MDYQSFQPGGQKQSTSPSPTLEILKIQNLNDKLRPYRWHIAISSCVVIVLLFGAYSYLKYTNEQSAQEVVPTFTPRPSATADPTANWKTYTNTKYGFEFKYPSDLKPESFIENSELAISVGDPAGKPDMTLWVKNVKNKTPENIIEEERQRLYNMIDQELAEFKKNDITVSSTVVAGYPAKSISVNNLGDSGDTTTVFLKGDYIFEFKTNSFIEDQGDEILSTFKFTDSTGSGQAGSVDTSTWKTYTNTQYGFEFKYPGNLENGSTSDGFPELNLENGIMNFHVASNVINNGIYIADYFGELRNPQEIQVVGKTAYRFREAKADCVGYLTIVPMLGKSIEISFDNCYIGGPPASSGFPDSKLPLLNQILSTFKFTK